jgi:hypothetical protein
MPQLPGIEVANGGAVAHDAAPVNDVVQCNRWIKAPSPEYSVACA